MSGADLEIVRTEDNAAVAITLRAGDGKGIRGELTPAQARQAGASLVARASEIDAAGAASACVYCGRPVDAGGRNRAYMTQAVYAGTEHGAVQREPGRTLAMHITCGLPPSLEGKEPGA